MLSQTAEYALRALVLLAQGAPDRTAKVGELADSLDIPQNYLSKTLHTLVGSGVVASARGKGGGFRLAKAPNAISLLDIVDPFDRLGDRPACLLGQGECSDAHACAAHASWKAVSQQVHLFFRTTTLADLAGSAKVRSLVTPGTRRRAKKVARR